VQEINIECGAGKNAYTVTLTGTSRQIFEAAAKHARTKGKTGETLVAALLAAAGGDIPKVVRKNKNGEFNDGADGEPAVQYFSFDGAILQTEHFRNGLRNDSVSGAPAFTQKVYENGKLLLKIEHFKDGLLNDGVKGDPAIQRFEDDILVFEMRGKDGRRSDGKRGEPAHRSFREDGTPVFVKHYKDNILNDSREGKPAVQEFDALGRLTIIQHFTDGLLNDSAKGDPAHQEFDEKGKLISADSYKNGVFVRKFTDMDIARYLWPDEETKQQKPRPPRP